MENCTKNIMRVIMCNGMMRSVFKGGCLLGVMVLAVFVTGCGKTANVKKEAVATMETEVTPESTTEATSETTPAQVIESAGAEETIEPQLIDLLVYYGNDDCDALDSKMVSVEKVDGDVIVSELIKVGVLEKDVLIKGISQKEKKGKVIVTLDFNGAFQKQLESNGSTGERILMGAVVNTFLDAMSADKVKITVNGDVPESGHEVYSEAMGRFEFSE